MHDSYISCAAGAPSLGTGVLLQLSAAILIDGTTEKKDRRPGEISGRPGFVEMVDIARLAEAFAGVRRTAPEGLAQWRYHRQAGSAAA